MRIVDKQFLKFMLEIKGNFMNGDNKFNKNSNQAGKENKNQNQQNPAKNGQQQGQNQQKPGKPAEQSKNQQTNAQKREVPAHHDGYDHGLDKD